MVSGATRWIGASMRIAASVIGTLLFLISFDQRFETIETDRPEFLPLPQPILGFLERLCFEPNEMRAPSLATRDQPRVLEHLDVLRRSREAHLEGARELSDGLFAERETGKHPAPGRIGERVERCIESFFNHVV